MSRLEKHLGCRSWDPVRKLGCIIGIHFYDFYTVAGTPKTEPVAEIMVVPTCAACGKQQPGAKPENIFSRKPL